jgi:small membrane protein
MVNIKVILLIPLLILIITFLPKLGNRTFYRLSLIGISTLGVLFVLFPAVTDKLAHLVGVGRGADLVTYLFMVFFFLAGIILYSKMRKLEAEQTQLVRRISLQNAEKLNQP